MSDWQPIETAPKDGTRILVARNNVDGTMGMAVARWRKKQWFTGKVFHEGHEIIIVNSEPNIIGWQLAPSLPEPPK